MKRNFSLFLTGAFVYLSFIAAAQAQVTLNGQRIGVVNSAVPFLNFSPDARSSALGDAGVALRDPDANAIYWNPSKLVYAKDPAGASISYTPWLRNLVGDMYFTNLSGYKKIGKDQVIGVSLLYFDLGTIDFTNATGVSIGTFNSREYAATVSYSRRLFKNFSMGVNLKYINSNLAAGYSGGSGGAITPGATAAVDIGAYYQNQARDEVSGKGLGWSYGLMVSNIGGKINYGSPTKYFIPTNLRLGGGLTYYADQRSKFNFVLDFNKLMVPTPPVYGPAVSGVSPIVAGKDPNRSGAVLTSFFDAPGGFSEELKEISISAGAEYWYNEQFAARLGYFNESADKGNRKYFTAGLGIHLQQRYGVDFSYLLPVNSSSPLANTFRLSLVLKFDGTRRNQENDDAVETDNTTNPE